MAFIYKKAYFDNKITDIESAELNIASSAVLYGLSAYTVFPVHINNKGQKVAFRLDDHYKRLINSARIIGIDTFEPKWNKEKFIKAN